MAEIFLPPIAIIESLFLDEEMKDFVIVAGSGAEIKCHGAVLAARSDVFRKMVVPSTGMKESTTKRIEMRHLSEDCVNLMVKYMYGKSLPSSKFTCDGALELFQAAGLYNLNHLKIALKQMFVGKPASWFEANFTLELFFHVTNDDSMKELETHLLRVLKGMPDLLRTCDGFKKLDQVAVTDLLFKLVDLKDLPKYVTIDSCECCDRCRWN